MTNIIASDRFIRQAIVARLKVGAIIKNVWLYEKGKKRLFLMTKSFIKKQRRA